MVFSEFGLPINTYYGSGYRENLINFSQVFGDAAAAATGGEVHGLYPTRYGQPNGINYVETIMAVVFPENPGYPDQTFITWHQVWSANDQNEINNYSFSGGSFFLTRENDPNRDAANDSQHLQSVPEPSSFALLGLAMLPLMRLPSARNRSFI